MIIVSGCPGSGAHDLAARLSDRMGFQLWQSFKNGDADADFSILMRRILTASPYTIWPGGPADLYAQASAGFGFKLSRWQQSMMERALQSRPTIIVDCAFDGKLFAEHLVTIRRRRDAKSQVNPTPRELECGDMYVDGYNEWMSNSILERRQVDWHSSSDNTIGDIQEDIASDLYGQRRAYQHHIKFYSTGEYRKPELVIVGEGLPEGPMNQRPADLPFCRPSGASEVLSKVMVQLGIRRAYLTNVCKTGDEFTDQRLLADELHIVDGAIIIAIGETAGRTLRRIRAAHSEIPHPSRQASQRAQHYDSWLSRMRAAIPVPLWPEIHLAQKLG